MNWTVRKTSEFGCAALQLRLQVSTTSGVWCSDGCIWIITIGVGKIGMSYSVLPFCTGQHKPASSYEKITINKNSRATLNSLRHIIRKNKYRKDLRMVRFISTVDWLNLCAAISLFYNGWGVCFISVFFFVFSARLPCVVPVPFWRARSLLWSKRSALGLPKQHKQIHDK